MTIETKEQARAEIAATIQAVEQLKSDHLVAQGYSHELDVRNLGERCVRTFDTLKRLQAYFAEGETPSPSEEIDPSLLVHRLVSVSWAKTASPYLTAEQRLFIMSKLGHTVLSRLVGNEFDKTPPLPKSREHFLEIDNRTADCLTAKMAATITHPRPQGPQGLQDEAPRVCDFAAKVTLNDKCVGLFQGPTGEYS